MQPRSSGARSKSAERGTGGVRSYGVHLHPGKNSEDWQRGVLALGAGSSEKDREGGGRSGGVLARPREPPSISAEMALGTKQGTDGFLCGHTNKMTTSRECPEQWFFFSVYIFEIPHVGPDLISQVRQGLSK